MSSLVTAATFLAPLEAGYIFPPEGVFSIISAERYSGVFDDIQNYLERNTFRYFS